MTVIASTPSIDIQAVLDRQTRLRPQIPLLVLMTIIMFLDGYDVFMLGKIAPAMAEDFGEPVTGLTLVFVLQQIGLAVGSFLISPLSDLFGRKRMLLVSVTMFGLLTLAIVWSQSLFHVAILRGLSGLFLAGVIPNAAALLTEYAPPGRRASFVSIAFTGYTAGGAAGAFVAIWLLDSYGWQSGFWIGGLVPLLLVPVYALWTDESLHFRARRDASDPRIGKTLRRIDATLAMDAGTRYVIGPDAARKPPSASVLRLFERDRIAMTALLWIAYFVALGTITLLASWMATLFLKLDGIPVHRFAAYSLLSFVGGITGTTTVGYLMDRFGQTRVLVILFLVDAIALASVGQVEFGSAAFVAVLLVWGYCQAGGQGGINALCAQAYPTEIRSAGVGWAFGMGRIGGVVLPVFGGIIIASGMSLAQGFLWMGLLPLLVAAALFAIGRLSARQRIAS